MNLKYLKRWLEIQFEEHEGFIIILILIACVTMATLFTSIHYYITIPNQACNQCSYGQAIEVNPTNLMSSEGNVQCSNEKIIYYKTSRNIKDKWGNDRIETGFWVTC